MRTFLLCCLVWLVGCSTTGALRNRPPVTPNHQDFVFYQLQWQSFARRGPYKFNSRVNESIKLSPSRDIMVDVYVPEVKQAAPLVILQHGNYSRKEAHREQAQHLASWGFHVVVPQLPNRDDWPTNGKRTAELCRYLYTWPKIIAPNVDTGRIYGVGHSFGGSAMMMAGGKGAPFAGFVLLDPAVVHPRALRFASAVSVPTVILDADRRVFVTRGRGKFFQAVQGDAMEISVRKATHDDAQMPSMFSRYNYGIDPYTSDVRQKVFLTTLTASLVTLSGSGSIQEAWSTLAVPRREAVLIEGRKKIQNR